MDKRRWLSLVLTLSLFFSISFPMIETKAVSKSQQLDKQIQQIQLKKKEAANKARNIDMQLKQINSTKKSIQKELVSLETQINETENKIFTLEGQIEKVTTQAKEAANQLELAEKRVEERDDLLRTRVRLMARNRDVDYLDVFLGATSFSDFLQRFNILQKIVDSDKKILEENIKDRNTIVEKKKEIERSLARLEQLFGETENLRKTLVAKKEERKVKIASLNQQAQELAEFKEEEQNLVKELAEKEAALLREKNKLNIKYSGGKFAWPLPASTRITSDFGLRIHPITGKKTGHDGIDIGAPQGIDIVAADDGVVILATYVSGYGNTVMIDHGSGIWTLYGHIRNGGIKVKVGQEVKKGEKIAEVGSTGRSTGPHLHFEVQKNKQAVNPWNYLKK
ncbi:murein hydrolase activator EnvC [Tepidibacillus infernus]|uniref:murein hydrolase activator EnvC family protein n=1 Tax=Tepidibacillus infernus TaxID=1806172 RepID=UPI003B7070E5